jgi:hypothetical protein
MGKRKKHKKPNCNHPPDQREQVGSDSHHFGGADHVQRVYRCKECGCWKNVTTHSDGSGSHEGRWNAASVRYPYWMKET